MAQAVVIKCDVSLIFQILLTAMIWPLGSVGRARVAAGGDDASLCFQDVGGGDGHG